MIRRPPRSTQSRSSAASDVYKRQVYADVSQIHVQGTGAGERERGERQGQHLAIGFDVRIAIELGTDLQHFARTRKPWRDGAQDAARVAQAVDAKPGQEERI